MRVKAIVTVSVTIVLEDSWNEACQLDQVFNQAGNKARNVIAQHLTSLQNITIHKHPQVEAVITERKPAHG